MSGAPLPRDDFFSRRMAQLAAERAEAAQDTRTLDEGDRVFYKALLATFSKPATLATLTGSYEDLMDALSEGRPPVTLFPADEALAPHATSANLMSS